MSKHGKIRAPQKMADEYQTPENHAELLVRRLGIRGTFWEPFAGGGNICRPLARAGNKVIAYDVRNYGYPLDKTVDFFDVQEPPHFDHIISNPPYGKLNVLIGPVIERLLPMRPVNGVIALLLPSDYDMGSTRKSLFYECPSYRGQIKIMDRLIWIPGTKNGGTTNYIWHVWGPTGFNWSKRPRLPIVDYMRSEIDV